MGIDISLGFPWPTLLAIQLVVLSYCMQVKLLSIFTFTFTKRRIRPLNALQQVSNTNHVGSVSDSLARLAAVNGRKAERSMAGRLKNQPIVHSLGPHIQVGQGPANFLGRGPKC